MKSTSIVVFFCMMLLPILLIADNPPPPPIPIEDGWDNKEDGDRLLISSPSLHRDENFVYVYSEKQLDNVTIGITDMQGNTYHYEVTTIPACTYYAVSIDSLPSGQYYLCVYQGSNYVIGIFTTN